MTVIALWSMKGGVGVTTTAALVAAEAANQANNVIVVDLAGDVAAAFGQSIAPEPIDRADWFDNPTGQLDSLSPQASIRFAAIDTPTPDEDDDGSGLAGRCGWVIDQLRAAADVVVVDCGNQREPDQPTPAYELAQQVIEAADVSWVVVRPCYLAIRRSIGADADGVVLVHDADYGYRASDITEALKLPMVVNLQGIAECGDGDQCRNDPHPSTRSHDRPWHWSGAEPSHPRRDGWARRLVIEHAICERTGRTVCGERLDRLAIVRRLDWASCPGCSSRLQWIKTRDESVVS